MHAGDAALPRGPPLPRARGEILCGSWYCEQLCPAEFCTLPRAECKGDFACLDAKFAGAGWYLAEGRAVLKL